MSRADRVIRSPWDAPHCNVQTFDVGAFDGRHRESAERGQDVLRQQPFIVEGGAGLEFWSNVIGHPFFGQLRHGHRARCHASLAGLPLDNRISALADVREHVVGLLARLGYFQWRPMAYRSPGLADKEDAPARWSQPVSKRR